MHYYMYYKEELSLNTSWQSWDLFISAYNLSDRIKAVFEKVSAEKKCWINFPEYSFGETELPLSEEIYNLPKGSEAIQLLSFIHKIGLISFKDKKICIDSTGFMRAQLLFLIAFLKKNGFSKVHIIYSEPRTYSKKENTSFSVGSIYETRQVIGYQGTNVHNQSKDLLIISCGYDSKLISRVCQQYENSDILPLFGFPSLRADMFQESILKTIAADEAFGAADIMEPIFSPASDPFETAKSISDYIKVNSCLSKYKHIYLCPLSTKPQVIGMGLVFLNEFENTNVSILYPFSENYSKETSQGISKLWLYTIEF